MLKSFLRIRAGQWRGTALGRALARPGRRGLGVEQVSAAVTAYVAHGSPARTSRLCTGPSAPLLLRHSPHRRSIRVLALDPIWRTTGSISRVLPLRDDAFEAKLACVMEDIRAVCLQMLIQSQAQRRSREKAAECCLANDERIVAQIIAVEFDQVEGVEENAIIVVPVTDAVERRYPILAARDRLSVDDAGPGAQLGDRLDDEGKSVGQVIARPAIELQPFSVLAGDDPKAVVLDFMQPLLARRRLRVMGRHGAMNPAGRARGRDNMDRV